MCLIYARLELCASYMHASSFSPHICTPRVVRLIYTYTYICRSSLILHFLFCFCFSVSFSYSFSFPLAFVSVRGRSIFFFFHSEKPKEPSSLAACKYIVVVECAHTYALTCWYVRRAWLRPHTLVAYMYTHIRTYLLIYIHIYARTCLYIYTYTHVPPGKCGGRGGLKVLVYEALSS
jgi:hypothetical protein